MTTRPEYTDPYAAAHVSDFMAAARIGRWRLHPFEVDERHHDLSRLKAMHDAGDNEFRRDALLKRVIPPGSYICLQRRRTEPELKDDPNIDIVNEGYVPVMSDTPDEIAGHAHAIEHATGRVLIHGLGLGCLVSALLARPDVTHIDVVEIDPDVIRLVAPYYIEDPRVKVHRGDCMRMNWSPAERWDYVWHDIWTHISARNLEPATAEHGISYGMLFGAFSERATIQAAWAYEEVIAERAAAMKSWEERRGWEDAFWAADLETRIQMVFEEKVREHIRSLDGHSVFKRGQVPQHLLDFFEEQMPGIRKHIRAALLQPTFTREHFEQWREQDEPLGNPNEILER